VLVVFNRAEFQHLKIFLLKCLLPMVPLLIQEVTLHSFDLGRTDRDTKITGLPLELLSVHDVMNPGRLVRLDVPKNIVQPMSRTQTNEKMNMVFDASYGQRHTLDSLNNTAEIGMKVCTPVFSNDWQAVLG